jgi:hypothetical protein
MAPARERKRQGCQCEHTGDFGTIFQQLSDKSLLGSLERKAQWHRAIDTTSSGLFCAAVATAFELRSRGGVLNNSR